MSVAEVLGYLASALVFMTFYMKTMIPLRTVAVVSNMAFIGYAFIEDLVPILILHCLLLPMNLHRLHQMRRLVVETAAFRDRGFPLEPLIPFMQKRPLRRGEVLFRKGDMSAGMYYLAKGRVRIVEVGALLHPGDIFGEISLFAPDKLRTATAVADEDGSIFWLSEATVVQIFHQNPRFGYHLVRAIAGRLVENCQRLERQRSSTSDQAAPGPVRERPQMKISTTEPP